MMRPSIHKTIKTIGIDDCCEVLEACTIKETVDLGSTIIHCVDHPDYGKAFIINTASGQSAILIP